MANIIEKTQRPTLILAHNKTLAGQLYSEFKEMLKNSANPLKKIDYRKEDGTPDRIKNGLQSALTTAVWT